MFQSAHCGHAFPQYHPTGRRECGVGFRTGVLPVGKRMPWSPALSTARTPFLFLGFGIRGDGWKRGMHDRKEHDLRRRRGLSGPCPDQRKQVGLSDTACIGQGESKAIRQRLIAPRSGKHYTWPADRQIRPRGVTQPQPLLMGEQRKAQSADIRPKVDTLYALLSIRSCTKLKQAHNSERSAANSDTNT